jgi:citrate synthase
MMNSNQISPGLEDVNIKWTRLTSIDGNKGILRYSGYSIDDIIKSGADVGEIQYLFLNGKLPNKEEFINFSESVERGYNIPDYVIKSIRNLPVESDSVAMQMASFASLAAAKAKFRWDKDKDRTNAAEAIGTMLAVTANVYRHFMGLEPVVPEKQGGFAETFLNACFDKKPSKEEVEAMNAALILYTDHEVPASTTAGLVAVSTLSDMYSGVTAALAALKGPLHGGAAEAAIAQFASIGSVDNVEKWFDENIVKNKSRLMGFGHRVYRTWDPRGIIFREKAGVLVKKNKEAENLFKIAVKLQDIAIPKFGNKGIYPNTDYYSGIVYMSLGFPLKNNIYTGLFALSRITGLMAHFIEYVEEQQRLIRPRSIYKGPEPRDFVPISKR